MDFTIARKNMILDLQKRGIRDSRVLEAMMNVPRHEFVDPGMKSLAYQDTPLNIGLKQTISQPYIVALMTQSLELRGNEKILEIGTGSGYQTTILSRLCKHVYSVERLTSLSNTARKIIYRMAIMNVSLRIGDGTMGWSEESPFDAIIVTAGSPKIPQALLSQLRDGGVLIIPCGGEESQELLRIRRTGDSFQEERLSGCRFVKLYGREGWSEALEERVL